MILTIPNKVSWQKDITANSLEHYSKNIAKRIGKTQLQSSRDGITYEVKELTKDLLDWFTPIYNEKISGKNSPVVSDLYTTTQNNPDKNYQILIVSENDVRVGGVIFSVTQNDLNIAYKIFSDSWISSTLPASPSLYADYLLTVYGFKTGKTMISHGKDRNGYGKTSSIGLAIFKISLGYKPCLPKKFIQSEVNTSNIDCDSLYFVNTDNPKELVGNLFTTPLTQEKWSRLNSYQDCVTINWIMR